MKNLVPEDEKSLDTGRSFSHVYNIIRSLRGPNGCPWDKEQTALTLRNALVEEAYESIEAINNQDREHMREELGDVLLVTLLISYIEEQSGAFSVQDVISGLSEKLIRRHPHVFGEENLQSSEEVLIQWDKIKALNEGRGVPSSILDSVPKHLPNMDRSFKLQKKAAKYGFDWQDHRGVLEKIREELDEVEDVLTRLEEHDENSDAASLQQELEYELGDVLFAVINLARKTGVHPNEALSRTNSKFYRRFSYIEEKMLEVGLEMKPQNLDQMERFWIEAKHLEQRQQTV